MKTRALRSIEEDTSLLPHIAADAVVHELAIYLGVELPTAHSDFLAQRAETIYRRNVRFRARVRSNADGGNAGREWLYCFMRHWLAGKLLRECPDLGERIPAEFRRGLPAVRRKLDANQL